MVRIGDICDRHDGVIVVASWLCAADYHWVLVYENTKRGSFEPVLHKHALPLNNPNYRITERCQLLVEDSPEPRYETTVFDSFLVRWERTRGVWKNNAVASLSPFFSGRWPFPSVVGGDPLFILPIEYNPDTLEKYGEYYRSKVPT